jgi:hypothetical protein
MRLIVEHTIDGRRVEIICGFDPTDRQVRAAAALADPDGELARLEIEAQGLHCDACGLPVDRTWVGGVCPRWGW